MQRLHEDDWSVMRSGRNHGRWCAFRRSPKRTRCHQIDAIWEPRTFTRREGEALHREREPLDTLDRIHRTVGEYNFGDQYQQALRPWAAKWSKPNGSLVIEMPPSPASRADPPQ
jgi:hypothetical protein